MSALFDYLAIAVSVAAAFFRLFFEFLEPKKLKLSRVLVLVLLDLGTMCPCWHLTKLFRTKRNIFFGCDLNLILNCKSFRK